MKSMKEGQLLVGMLIYVTYSSLVRDTNLACVRAEVLSFHDKTRIAVITVDMSSCYGAPINPTYAVDYGNCYRSRRDAVSAAITMMDDAILKAEHQVERLLQLKSLVLRQAR